MSSRADDIAVAHALAYPFTLPTRSFLFHAGNSYGLREWDAAAPTRSIIEVDGAQVTVGAWLEKREASSITARAAVLAYGSNASIEALRRKFERCSSSLVPVVIAELQDFDVVYSAHIGTYGSIPATLQSAPGTAAPVYVLYLTSEQLEALHVTEPNYFFGELSGISLTDEFAHYYDNVFSYSSRHGCLTRNGDEIALAEVMSRDRRFDVLAQRDAIELARQVTAPEMDLNAFILDNIAHPEDARKRTAKLREQATPLQWPGWTQLRD